MSDKQHFEINKLLPSNLKTNIAEEIGSGGTEGDTLDMQIKNEFDPLQPHLYWHPEPHGEFIQETHEEKEAENVVPKEGFIKKLFKKKGESSEKKKEEKVKGEVTFLDNLGALIDE